LPTLLQYVHRWPAPQTDKFATAVGLLLAQGLANASSLQILTKDHLIKNGNLLSLLHHWTYALLTRRFTDVAINVLTRIMRAYLTEQSMDHLSATLKKGGTKDLLAFFPANKREGKYLEEHFKTEGLPQVAEWWTKKQYAALKESLVRDLSDMIEHEDTAEQVFHGSPSVVSG